ncbi:hypothetical protein ACTWOF_005059 [Klebsiella michiganensis]
MTSKLTITDERVISVIERLEHYACNLKWTNVRGAQDLLTAADGLRELQERRKAAMDSEPVEMPLDYLQGHKDGLEWASQLAEANHPETGDWLYDDPIELAKAIRKGPDMPPVQPVADSEPDRNPVLAYADSYRDMAKQGVESVPIWSVITDIERNIAPLYRHAQPVVLDDGRADFEAWMLMRWGRERRDDDFAMGKFIYGEDYADSYTRCVWKAWFASRSAMLSGGKS